MSRKRQLVLTAMVTFGMQSPVAPMPCVRAADGTGAKERDSVGCNWGTECLCFCTKRAPARDETPEPDAPNGCACGSDRAPRAVLARVAIERSTLGLAATARAGSFYAPGGFRFRALDPTAHGPPPALVFLETTILQI